MPVAEPDVGYLQVQVRSGAEGGNPVIPDARVTIGETGFQANTSETGVTPSIRLKATDIPPVVPSRKIGYYTVSVTKAGFRKHIHHTFVYGGSTEWDPTRLDVYLIPGKGEESQSDSPVGGRTVPQTAGPAK